MLSNKFNEFNQTLIETEKQTQSYLKNKSELI